MNGLGLIRLSIAMVWVYQGLWCKVLGRARRQGAMAGAVPGISAGQARAALRGLGAVECGMAVWVLSGWHAREAALAQTGLLAAMNAGGLWWAARLIPDPVGMVLQNLVLVVLAWVAAGEVHA